MIEFFKAMPTWYIYILIYVGATGWLIAQAWNDLWKEGKKLPSLKENIGWSIFLLFWPILLPLLIIAFILDTR